MRRSENSSFLPSEGFVRLPGVIGALGIGRTTWWNGIRKGRFPRPVKLGPRTSAWRVEDIRGLIARLGNSDGNSSIQQKGEFNE